jgi:FtsH-binding integral membrane protein
MMRSCLVLVLVAVLACCQGRHLQAPSSNRRSVQDVSIVAQYQSSNSISGRPFSGQSGGPYSGQGQGQSRDMQPVQNYEPRTLADFTTRDSRMGFIRKVYTIFGVQMFTTICITALIMNNYGIQNFFFQNYQAMFIASTVISTGIILTLVSNKELRYKAPNNFILLGVHTIMQSLMVGTFSSMFNPKTVCLGTMHTLTAFLAITLYSFQPNPKYDLTVFGNGLLTALTSLMLGSILGFFFHLPLLDNVISGCLAVVFALYLYHDTQKIIGGKHHKYHYGQKEYILAALNLYQDVLNFYIQMMKLLSKTERQ